MKKQIICFSLAILLLAGVGIANAQTSIALMPSQVSFTSSLGIGSKGNIVTALQQFLVTKGYLHATGSTGYYGPLTAAAVSQFQAANNLPQVGRVGPMTMALLNAQIGGVTMQQTTVTQPQMGSNDVVSGSQMGASNGMNAHTALTQSFAPGCTSTSGYSSTTGLPCNNTPTTSVYPAGCVSGFGYSTTTGQPCTPSTTSTGNGSSIQLCPNGDTLASNCTIPPSSTSTISTGNGGSIELCPNGDTLASNCTLPPSSATTSIDTISINRPDIIVTGKNLSAVSIYAYESGTGITSGTLLGNATLQSTTMGEQSWSYQPAQGLYTQIYAEGFNAQNTLVGTVTLAIQGVSAIYNAL